MQKQKSQNKINPLTQSRKRKIEILKIVLNDCIDLLLLKSKQRDHVHMSYFKKLLNSVKKLREEVI